jgi:predicted kinase
MKYKIGTKVITRSNEDEPYKIGHITTYDTGLDNCPDDVPLVEMVSNGEQVLCFSIHVPYTEDLIARLDKLKYEEQYTLLWATRANDKGKKFILMRGLPGSGKSTKARELAEDGQIFSTDDYFCLNEEQEYRFNGNLLGKAHSWNQRRSLKALESGIPIVVIDNTNTTLKEMRSYLPHINLAMRMGYEVCIAEPDTEWQFDVDKLDKHNTHGVPKKHIQKMLNRYTKDVKVEDIIFLFSHPSTQL